MQGIHRQGVPDLHLLTPSVLPMPPPACPFQGPSGLVALTIMRASYKPATTIAVELAKLQGLVSSLGGGRAGAGSAASL